MTECVKKLKGACIDVVDSISKKLDVASGAPGQKAQIEEDAGVAEEDYQTVSKQHYIL